jgi:chromosome partitioning protein
MPAGSASNRFRLKRIMRPPWLRHLPMVTIIGSLKGGSGKSTVTFNLAVWLAMADVNVQLVDADPQATLADVVDVRMEEGFDPPLRVDDQSGLTQDHFGGADETLIDVGTADMDAMRRALQLCDRVVVPVPPSQADIWSTQRYIHLVKSTPRDKPAEMLGFINRGDTHHAVRETNEAAAALVSLPGIKFIKPRLSQRTVFRRSFSEGLAVFELDPRGKASREFFSLAAALYPNLVS